MSEMYCPNCGEECREGVRFCQRCGAALAAVQSSLSPAQSGPDPAQSSLDPHAAAPARTGKKRKESGKKKERSAEKTEGRKGNRWVSVVAIVAAAALLMTSGVLIGLKLLSSGDRNAQKSQTLTVKKFDFIQSAFLCGAETETTRVIAVVDPRSDTSGLELYAVCRETGEEIRLTDDGKGADYKARDNVFYGTASFSSAEEKTLTYTLQARPDDCKLRAPEATVQFYTMETIESDEKQMKQMLVHLNNISAGVVYEEKSDPKTNAESYRLAAEAMREYLAGLQEKGDISSYEWNPPYFTVKLQAETFTYGLGEFGEAPEGGEYSVGEETAAGRGARRALSLLPYEDSGLAKHLDPDSTRDAMETVWGAGLGYSLMEKTNGSVDLATLNALEDYRFVAINTHGGNSADYGPFFALGCRYDSFPVSDRADGSVLLSGDGWRAMVTSKYFEKHYADGQMNGCLIYLGCCHSADDSVLAETLLRKGAGAVLGFRGTVSTDYCGKMLNGLADNLVMLDAEVDGATIPVSAALESAKKTYGEKEMVNTYQFDMAANRITVSQTETNTELLLFRAEDCDFRLVDPAAPDPGEEDGEAERLRVENAIDDFLNGFVNVGVCYLEAMDWLLKADGSNYSQQAILSFLSPLYCRLHEEDPVRYPHDGIASRHRDYYVEYSLNDVAAVLDRLYGAGQVTPRDYFGQDNTYTPDGYLSMGGTDYLLSGVNWFHVHDIVKTDDGYRATVSCIVVDCDFVEDDSGWSVPNYSMYYIYDAVTGEIIDSGSDPDLRSFDDYVAIAQRFDGYSRTERIEVDLYEDADGFHILAPEGRKSAPAEPAPVVPEEPAPAEPTEPDVAGIYAEVIRNGLPYDAPTCFLLTYMDEDDVPELVFCHTPMYSPHNMGAWVYTIVDGEAVEVGHFGSSGELEYGYKSGFLFSSYTGMGATQAELFRLENGRTEKLALYLYNWRMEDPEGWDNPGDWECEIDGEEVTRDEYEAHVKGLLAGATVYRAGCEEAFETTEENLRKLQADYSAFIVRGEEIGLSFMGIREGG